MLMEQMFTAEILITTEITDKGVHAGQFGAPHPEDVHHSEKSGI